MKKFLLLITLLSAGAAEAQQLRPSELAHTYSIVARDPNTGELAVAVQSHWFSVGTAVSWAEAGVGAVATQSFTNKSFGLRGLALLKEGKTAKEALDALLASDEGREVRQVAIVDNQGRVAVHTGSKCIAYAGHITGEGFSVQANMMLTDKVPAAMAKSYRDNAKLPLPERVLEALKAAEAAGGDIRGKQSAAVLVVPGKSQNEPWNERSVDLRVDDHTAPLVEMERLLKVQRAYEHMNAGDLAVEKNDMKKAMAEYNAAMKMFPSNLEMQFWTAVTLANNKEVGKALPMFQKIFQQDKNWKELTRRLPPVGLLTVSKDELGRILQL